MKKTNYELKNEIREVLSNKRGKKVKLKDNESAYDVYYRDGITYECILRYVYMSSVKSVHVGVESLQGYEEWDADIVDVSARGVAAIAEALGIDLERKPTMQESYDILCEHYEHLKDSIREYVNAHADENGLVLLDDCYDISRPWVITTMEHAVAPDSYTECRCLALRVVNDAVQFCAMPSATVRDGEQFKSSVLSQENFRHMWYVLDWDYSNPFQYNIERIAFYLTQNN